MIVLCFRCRKKIDNVTGTYRVEPHPAGHGATKIYICECFSGVGTRSGDMKDGVVVTCNHKITEAHGETFCDKCGMVPE